MSDPRWRSRPSSPPATEPDTPKLRRFVTPGVTNRRQNAVVVGSGHDPDGRRHLHGGDRPGRRLAGPARRPPAPPPPRPGRLRGPPLLRAAAHGGPGRAGGRGSMWPPAPDPWPRPSGPSPAATPRWPWCRPCTPPSWPTGWPPPTRRTRSGRPNGPSVSPSAAEGRQWGTITSEPGSGGDIAKTKAVAVADPDLDPLLEGAPYRVTGAKHFGSGSGIADRMMTTAVAEGEDKPTIFVLDSSRRAGDDPLRDGRRVGRHGDAGHPEPCPAPP